MTNHIKTWAAAVKARLARWRVSLSLWFNDTHGGYAKVAAHTKLWTLFICIFGSGYTAGYWYNHFSESSAYVAQINRLQTRYAALIDTLNTRLPAVTDKLSTTSGQVSQVAGQIGQAAQILDQATNANVQATRNANDATVQARVATQQAQGAARNAESSLVGKIKALKNAKDETP